MLLVETGAGVGHAATCAAASPRVLCLQVGEQDLRADLGLGPEAEGDNETLQTARSLVVLASAAAGLRAPVAPVTTQIVDAPAVRASTARLRAAGFGSRAVIHPAQLEPVHDAYRPNAAELERARTVVAAAEKAAAVGAGAAKDDQGRMVDEPVLRQALAALADVGEIPRHDPARSRALPSTSSPEEGHHA